MHILITYRIIWVFLLPVYTLLTAMRLIKGKEDFYRITERWGFSHTKRPKGKLVWFHASSVGESLSILPLIKKLDDTHPEKTLLVTTGTKTSAQLMQKKLPQKAIHQYVPWDFYPFVKLFINKWHPTLSVFVESEFWPELLAQAPKPVLINGRVSDRSYPKYQKHKKYIQFLLNKFTLLLAQDALSEKRLRSLCQSTVICTGNLKLDAPLDPVEDKELAPFHQRIKGRLIWVVSSTHAHEEEKLLPVFKTLKETFPDLFLILAPRHPHRGEAVTRLFEAEGYSVTRRTKNHVLPIAANDVYIADTIGELPLWYTLADVVFIGGSLIPHGGQNPYEPLKRGKVVVCGPHMFNFKAMMSLFKQRQVILQADTPEKLTQDLCSILSQEDNRKKTEAHIQAQMEGLGGATEKTYIKLKDLAEGWSHAED